MTLKACVIGSGALGTLHAKAWAALKGAQLVAVCDPFKERADQLAASLGVDACYDYKKAIVRDDVDVVSVATPTCVHPEIACFAMNHGRHCLSEKPIALTLREADRMIQAAKKNKTKFSVSFQVRGTAVALRAKQLHDEGAFGGPIHAIYSAAAEVRPKVEMNQKNKCGGPIIDVVCHWVDLMRFVTGEEPVSVYAQGGIFARGKKRAKPFEKDLAIDAAAITVTYTGGHVLSYYINWGMPEGFKGFPRSQAFIGPEMCLSPSPEGMAAQFGDRKIVFNDPPAPLGPTVRLMDMKNAIENNKPLEVTGHDARVALEVSLAALKSVETGRVIHLKKGAKR